MRYDWDDAKSVSNLIKHGVLFDEAFAFEWAAALVRADVRYSYGEVRLTATAPIADEIYVLVCTIRRTRLRVISLRRASAKEILRYVAQI